MRELVSVVAVTMMALAMAWLAVTVQGATTFAVPPPESVAEQFARHVAARRYDRALQHVDEHSGITLTTVHRAGEDLRRRTGGIDQVTGEQGSLAATRATAAAVLTSRKAERIRYVFQLERRKGLWKIADWREKR